MGCAALLAGCASVATPMKHADGRIINCSAAGLGVIGTSAALIMRENCISNARQRGFVEIDEPLPAASGKASNYVYNGNAGINLPAGWTRTPAPAAYKSPVAYASSAAH